MKDQLKWVLNHMPKSDDQHLDVMSLPNVAKARSFHGSFPQYSITPLAQLDGMAQYLGLAGVYVKDESYRFGLNAFKVLGGSFAMARYIAGEMGRDVSEMNYDYLTSEAFRKEFGQATFFTATDGNHGRGVAWAANKLGQKSVVHMPKGSSKSRFDNIAKEGAKVTIEEVNYDDCVRMAAAEAAQTEHGVIVQDTAWDGYEEIPSWIMQGYGTMANEAADQLRQCSVNRPTHVFIQAGVGSLAGAVVGLFLQPDSALFASSVSALRLYSFAFLFVGFNVVISGFFTAMEHPIPSLTISFGRGLVLISGCLVALAFLFGANGIWLSPLVSESLCLLITLFFLIRYFRRVRREASGERDGIPDARPLV